LLWLLSDGNHLTFSFLPWSSLYLPRPFSSWIEEETTLKMLKNTSLLVAAVGLLAILSNMPSGHARAIPASTFSDKPIKDGVPKDFTITEVVLKWPAGMPGM
jgi:hypothetical protein